MDTDLGPYGEELPPYECEPLHTLVARKPVYYGCDGNLLFFFFCFFFSPFSYPIFSLQFLSSM